MGGGLQYTPEDEGNHAPGVDPWWQESVFLHWFDPAVGVGGVHRIGQEMAQDASALCCFVFDPHARYRRVERVPLLPPATPRGFRAGGSTWDIEDGRPRLRVKEDDLELDLVMENFYGLTDFFPSGGSMVEDFAKHHYETSGRVRGTAVLQGRSYEIDGLCHRDHSWGPRRWDQLLSHRWVSGTIGPELSFGSMAWHAADNSVVQVGYVVRDGDLILATSVDVVVHMEVDAVTHRGGEVRWTLADGSSLAARCTVIDGVVTGNHDVVWVDSLCEVTLDDGRRGYCDFEISTNPRAGTRDIGLAVRAALHNGWSTRT